MTKAADSRKKRVTEEPEAHLAPHLRDANMPRLQRDGELTRFWLA